MTESADLDVSEPVQREVHITANHENGEWIIINGMTTLDTKKYR